MSEKATRNAYGEALVELFIQGFGEAIVHGFAHFLQLLFIGLLQGGHPSVHGGADGLKPGIQCLKAAGKVEGFFLAVEKSDDYRTNINIFGT